MSSCSAMPCSAMQCLIPFVWDIFLFEFFSQQYFYHPCPVNRNFQKISFITQPSFTLKTVRVCLHAGSFSAENLFVCACYTQALLFGTLFHSSFRELRVPRLKRLFCFLNPPQLLTQLYLSPPPSNPYYPNPTQPQS